MHARARAHTHTHTHTHAHEHTHKHIVQTDRGEEQHWLNEIFGEEDRLEFVLEVRKKKERVAVSGTDVLREIFPAEGTEAWEKESKAF